MSANASTRGRPSETRLKSQEKHEKLADVHKVSKHKRKLEQILTNKEVTYAEKVSKLTKLISKLLGAAVKAKSESPQNAVAIDRKVKLVKWACHTAIKYVNEENASSKAIKSTNNGNDSLAAQEINRVNGDICRYMSICSGITRTERECTEEEQATREFWAKKAVQYYDYSNLTLGSYDVRIKHLFPDTPHNLLLVILFNMRKLGQVSTIERQKGLPPVRNSTLFVEGAINSFKDVQSKGRLYEGFVTSAVETINFLKHVYAGTPTTSLNMEKRIERIRKQWGAYKVQDVSEQDAIAMIFAFVMLASLVKNTNKPPVSFSFLIRSPPLREFVQSLINPDKPKHWSSPVLEYFFNNTTIDGEKFLTKIQKLNSRPADF